MSFGSVSAKDIINICQMNFIRNNSKVLGFGLVGGILGAVAIYYYRKSTLKQVVFDEPVQIKEEQKPAETILAIQQKLLKRVAEEELNEELLKEIAKELHAFTWKLTRQLDYHQKQLIFKNRDKPVKQYIPIIMKQMESTQEQIGVFRLEKDKVIHSLGLSPEQIKFINGFSLDLEKEEISQLGEFTDIAQEYLMNKIMIVSEKMDDLTKMLDEYQWTEQNQNWFPIILNILIANQIFLKVPSFLQYMLQIQTCIQKFPAEFEEQRQLLNTHLSPIYIQFLQKQMNLV